MFNDIVKRILKTDSAQPVGRMFDQYVDPDPSFKMNHSENISKLFNQYTNPGPAFKFSEQPSIFNDKYSVKGSEMPQAPIERPEDNVFTNFINPDILKLDYHDSVMPTFIEYGGKRELGKSIFERGLDREDFNMNATDAELSKLGVAREEFMRKFQLENNIDLKGKDIKNHKSKLTKINTIQYNRDLSSFEDERDTTLEGHGKRWKNVIEVEPVKPQTAVENEGDDVLYEEDFEAPEDIALRRAFNLKTKEKEEQFIIDSLQEKERKFTKRYKDEQKKINSLANEAKERNYERNVEKGEKIIKNIAQKHKEAKQKRIKELVENAKETFKSKSSLLKARGGLSTSTTKAAAAVGIPRRGGEGQIVVPPGFEDSGLNTLNVPTLQGIADSMLQYDDISNTDRTNYDERDYIIDQIITQLDRAIDYEKFSNNDRKILEVLKHMKTTTKNEKGIIKRDKDRQEKREAEKALINPQTPEKTRSKKEVEQQRDKEQLTDIMIDDRETWEDAVEKNAITEYQLTTAKNYKASIEYFIQQFGSTPETERNLKKINNFINAYNKIITDSKSNLKFKNLVVKKDTVVKNKAATVLQKNARGQSVRKKDIISQQKLLPENNALSLAAKREKYNTQFDKVGNRLPKQYDVEAAKKRINMGTIVSGDVERQADAVLKYTNDPDKKESPQSVDELNITDPGFKYHFDEVISTFNLEVDKEKKENEDKEKGQKKKYNYMNAADRKKANKLFTQLGAESLPTSSQIKKIRYSNVVKQLDKAYELKKELNKLEGQMTTKELQGRFTRSTTDDSAHRKQIRELENRLNKLNGLEHYNEEDTEEEIEEELYQPSRKSSRAAGGGGRGSGSSLQTEMRLPNPPTTQVRGVSRARAGPPGHFG